ncbi:MAG: hypothetical protein U1E81_09535 [Xanthobacteraceae bacterium]
MENTIYISAGVNRLSSRFVGAILGLAPMEGNGIAAQLADDRLRGLGRLGHSGRLAGSS